MVSPPKDTLLQNLERLIKVSDRVKIDDMVTILKISRADLLNKLLELSSKFHFRIQGEEIVFDTYASTTDFIARLEQDFRLRGKSGSKKD